MIRDEIKGWGHIVQYPTDAPPFHFRSIQPFMILWPIVFDLGKHIRNFKEKIAKSVYNRISPKSNQIIGIIRKIWLPSFVVIGWVALTLLYWQTIFGQSTRHVDNGSSLSFKLLHYLTLTVEHKMNQTSRYKTKYRIRYLGGGGVGLDLFPLKSNILKNYNSHSEIQNRYCVRIHVKVCLWIYIYIYAV